MTRQFGPTNPYVYLANNGPSTSDEIPNKMSYNDRMDGIRKFNLTANSQGASLGGGGHKHPVYYIEGKHSPDSVVSAWIEANPSSIENLPGRALVHRCPDKFRDVLRERLDVEYQTGNGVPSPGGECGLCGEEYDHTLPHHLRSECEAT